MKTKNKKMSIIIIGICAVLLCVLGVSIHHLTKKDNNESDYYLYINEDLVKDTYYYGEDFEFAQNMNIATLCKKEESNNDLEQAVVKMPHGERIKDIKDYLMKCGCEMASMSGAGGSVFGLCEKENLDFIYDKVIRKYKKVWKFESI